MCQKMSLIIDIDGTICKIKSKEEKYEDLKPIDSVVAKIKEYHKSGVKIILFTSRNMNTYKGNIGLINVNTAKILLKWLDKWEIPYDEIIYGKPWPGHFGFYIDDRAIRPREFLKYNKNELEEICINDRIEE